MAIMPFRPDLDGQSLRIAIVQARFNEWVGQAVVDACVDQLRVLGVADESMVLMTVPGALEVPQVLARLARMDDFDALIAAGCVMRGETYHFEVVANESARALAQLGLEGGVPVINAILTVDDEAQARARAADKGRDAADAAVEMANLMLTLDSFDEDLALDQAYEEDERS